MRNCLVYDRLYVINEEYLNETQNQTLTEMYPDFDRKNALGIKHPSPRTKDKKKTVSNEHF